MAALLVMMQYALVAILGAVGGSPATVRAGSPLYEPPKLMAEWADKVHRQCRYDVHEKPYLQLDDDDHFPSRDPKFNDDKFSKYYKYKKQLAKAKNKKPAYKMPGKKYLEDDDPAVEAGAASEKKNTKNDGEDEMIVVAKDGSGDFTTVQAAIDKVAANNKKPVIIFVKKGIYREKVKIPNGKSFITLKGESAALTYIQWGDTASTKGPDGNPLGTYGSASVAIEADNFVALDISFKNTAPAPKPGDLGKQAVALRVQGDKVAFYRCSFYGAQDTLYDRVGRHYFYRCYIEGSIDFIFGDARSLYVKCHLHSIADPFGSIGAQKRMTPQDNTGFSFVYCVVTGSGSIYLGRAWGPYSRIVYLYTYMDDIITPQGWNDWNIPGNDNLVFYGEFRNFGPGANREGRVKWSLELTSKQARPFLSLGFIDGKEWLPH